LTAVLTEEINGDGWSESVGKSAMRLIFCSFPTTNAGLSKRSWRWPKGFDGCANVKG
jgi:hypothetical protein